MGGMKALAHGHRTQATRTTAGAHPVASDKPMAEDECKATEAHRPMANRTRVCRPPTGPHARPPPQAALPISRFPVVLICGPGCALPPSLHEPALKPSMQGQPAHRNHRNHKIGQPCHTINAELLSKKW